MDMKKLILTFSPLSEKFILGRIGKKKGLFLDRINADEMVSRAYADMVLHYNQKKEIGKGVEDKFKIGKYHFKIKATLEAIDE